MVATEMILNYLSAPIDTVGIVSIDTLFSIPDFRMNENIFGLLSRLRLKTSQRFIIQSRKPEEEVFRAVVDGDLQGFYRNEVIERKRFGYPPFKAMIKITAEGPAETTNKEMMELEKFLRAYDPKRFGAFVERVNNNTRVNILMKIDPASWPAKKDIAEPEEPYSNLLEILRSLPARFIVRVDTENTL